MSGKKSFSVRAASPPPPHPSISPADDSETAAGEVFVNELNESVGRLSTKPAKGAIQENRAQSCVVGVGCRVLAGRGKNSPRWRFATPLCFVCHPTSPVGGRAYTGGGISRRGPWRKTGEDGAYKRQTWPAEKGATRTARKRTNAKKPDVSTGEKYMCVRGWGGRRIGERERERGREKRETEKPR